MSDVSNRFLSTETILSFVTIIVVFAFGYGGLSSQVTALADEIEEVDGEKMPERMARIEQTVEYNSEKIDELKEQAKINHSLLEAILRKVGDE